MKLIENTVLNLAIFALASSVRSALDFDARHFGKRVTERYSKGARTMTAPEGASADDVKTFDKDHLPALKLAADMAKAGSVTFPVFCKELEIVRLAKLAADKASKEAEEAMKEGAKKGGAKAATVPAASTEVTKKAA